MKISTETTEQYVSFLTAILLAIIKKPENTNNLYFTIRKFISDIIVVAEDKIDQYSAIIVACIFAHLNGNEDAADIYEYYVGHDWGYLKSVIHLVKIPDFESFEYVLNNMNYNKLSICLENWVLDHYSFPQQLYKERTTSICKAAKKAKCLGDAINNAEIAIVGHPQISSVLYEMLKTGVRDPRDRKGRHYKVYADLLMPCALASFLGISDPKGIHAFCETHFLILQLTTTLHKIPSIATFERLFSDTKDEELAPCLESFLEMHFPPVKLETWKGKKQLMVDGKAMKAAAAKSDGEPPYYLINAMYFGDAHMLYVRDIVKKGNEQSQIANYITNFADYNTILTADAAATVEKTIKEVLRKKWDYLLPLKANQGLLFNFVWNSVINFKNTKIREGEIIDGDECQGVTALSQFPSYTKRNKGHGRRETYVCYTLSGENLKFLNDWINSLPKKDKSFYNSIKCLAIVEKETVFTGKAYEGKKPITSLRFFISNVEDITPEDVLELRSRHWSIEMGHYKLDLYMDEDLQTGHKGNYMAVGAVLRRFALRVHARIMGSKDKGTKEFLISNTDPLNLINTVVDSPIDYIDLHMMKHVFS